MAGADTVRIGIVDDDPIVRESLGSLLAREPDIQVVFLAADGAQCLGEATRARPDVVLMDIRMPGLDGVAAAIQLRRACPNAKVLLMTSVDHDDDVPAAIAAGASGLILKSSPMAVLADQIRSVRHGAAVWTADPFLRWGTKVACVKARVSRSESLGMPLTDREMEVLRLLCQAQTNSEIAASLHLAECTVKTYVSALLSKFGVTSRLKIVVYAHELGLV